MKLWPIKEDGVVRPLPALPGVIANAFQCNGCVRLPNFDLLIFLYLWKEFLLFDIDLQLTLMQSHIKGLTLSTWH